MQVTFLGTGTSQGVPIIGCDCDVCTSADKKDNRLRTSVWIEAGGVSLVIDSGPDFRYQMLRAGVRRLDALLFTHGHKDHTAGMDDVRAYNYFQQKPMDIYATAETQQVIRREFSYIFDNKSYPGIPQIDLHTIGTAPFDVHGLNVIPVRVLHYKLEVLGFRIGDFTYITDANFIEAGELDKLRGTRFLVLNALRHEPHISHFTLQEAIRIAQTVGAEHTYLTHISHQLGRHEEVSATLPAGVSLAYDGLRLEL